MNEACARLWQSHRIDCDRRIVAERVHFEQRLAAERQAMVETLGHLIATERARSDRLLEQMARPLHDAIADLRASDGRQFSGLERLVGMLEALLGEFVAARANHDIIDMSIGSRLMN
jgi:hypothetical protein